jgi:hypothetical protein
MLTRVSSTGTACPCPAAPSLRVVVHLRVPFALCTLLPALSPFPARRHEVRSGSFARPVALVDGRVLVHRAHEEAAGVREAAGAREPACPAAALSGTGSECSRLSAQFRSSDGLGTAATGGEGATRDANIDCGSACSCPHPSTFCTHPSTFVPCCGRDAPATISATSTAAPTAGGTSALLPVVVVFVLRAERAVRDWVVEISRSRWWRSACVMFASVLQHAQSENRNQINEHTLQMCVCKCVRASVCVQVCACTHSIFECAASLPSSSCRVALSNCRAHAPSLASRSWSAVNPPCKSTLSCCCSAAAHCDSCSERRTSQSVV